MDDIKEGASSKQERRVSFGKAQVRLLFDYRHDEDPAGKKRLEEQKSREEKSKLYCGSPTDDKTDRCPSRSPSLRHRKPILKKMEGTYDTSNETRRPARFTAEQKTRRAALAKAERTIHSGRKDKDSPAVFAERKKASYSSDENVSGEETCKLSKPKQTNRKAKEERNVNKAQRNTLEANGTHFSETAVNPRKKHHQSVQRNQLSSLTKSDQAFLNNQRIKKKNNDKTEKAVKTDGGFKCEYKSQQVETVKSSQVKNVEKWPGAKNLGPMKGSQSTMGVYTGVEADWGEAKNSLMKIGFDVGEDKLQKPSEFMAIMNMLLGLKSTAESPYKPQGYPFTADTNNTIVGGKKKQEHVEEQVTEDKTASEKSQNVLQDNRDDGNGAWESPQCTGSSGDVKDHLGAKEPPGGDKVGGNKGQFGKRIKRIKKTFHSKSQGGKNLKRSSSESSLNIREKQGRPLDIRNERCYSVDDLRDEPSTTNVSPGSNSRRQNNAGRSLWDRFTRRKAKEECDQDVDTERKSETTVDDEGQKNQERNYIEDSEEKPTLLAMSKQGYVSVVSGDSSLDQEADFKVIFPSGLGLRRDAMETRNFSEKSSEIEGIRANRNIKQDKEKSQTGLRKRKLGIASRVIPTTKTGIHGMCEVTGGNGVREKNRLEKADKIEETVEVDEAIEVEKAIKIRKAIKFEKAVQVKEDNQMKKAICLEEAFKSESEIKTLEAKKMRKDNKIEKAVKVKKGERIEKANKLEVRNEVQETSTVGAAGQMNETTAVKSAFQIKKTKDIEQAGQLLKTSETDKGLQVDKGFQVDKNDGVEKASQTKNVEHEQTGRSRIYVDKACQTKNRRKNGQRRRKGQPKTTDAKEGQQSSPSSFQLFSDMDLFFKMMSTLPGHQLCPG